MKKIIVFLVCVFFIGCDAADETFFISYGVYGDASGIVLYIDEHNEEVVKEVSLPFELSFFSEKTIPAIAFMSPVDIALGRNCQLYAELEYMGDIHNNVGDGFVSVVINAKNKTP